MNPDATSGPVSGAAAQTTATARRSCRICNQKGLHARAAARFVKTAAQFAADIQVRKNGTAVSGRSIMGLMMLAAASGAVVEITATGHDAANAVETLARLIDCKFDED
ncbi:MAG TPA: HPr family phosphocarrier protein [Stellaceae bacterium]|jgi:phosphocarrier protein|nr:HPr family phosphocarrier protein [Stellaceae bacterium]